MLDGLAGTLEIWKYRVVYRQARVRGRYNSVSCGIILIAIRVINHCNYKHLRPIPRSQGSSILARKQKARQGLFQSSF
jgi:hypothetical protein